MTKANDEQLKQLIAENEKRDIWFRFDRNGILLPQGRLGSRRVHRGARIVRLWEGRCLVPTHPNQPNSKVKEAWIPAETLLDLQEMSEHAARKLHPRLVAAVKTN